MCSQGTTAIRIGKAPQGLSTISMNYREMKIGYATKSELAVKQGQVDR